MEKGGGGSPQVCRPLTLVAVRLRAGRSQQPSDDQTLTVHESSKSSNLLSDETFDDSALEPVFNEQTCRRHMKVSRSGRFKEKRRPRSTLPIEEKGTENVPAGKEDKR
uniref:Uncharacterized protein n=1 Tax=Oryzias latipes TaxID=8090 RepID=H2LJI8_ORYLA